MARVLLKNIEKIYPNGFHAIHNVNFEIKDQELIVLVGPSGCGKSTTLRMIAGLEDITKGELYIGDKLVNDIPPKNRDIAMVFQDYALYPHMSVFENMAFSLKVRKFPKDEIKKRVLEAAKILHIEDQLNKKPKSLSGGQRQRVAMGRAIVRNPKVFLFDEPLSNLDAKLRVTMRAEIAMLHNKLNTTTVYVTHDQVEAMTLGTRIVVMKDGYVQQIDTPLNIYYYPANKFVAGFIGSPPMNFLVTTVRKGQPENSNNLYLEVDGSIIVPNKRQQEKLKPYINKKIIFGIRPEHIMEKRNMNKNLIKVNIQVIEPLGAQIFVYGYTKNNNKLIIGIKNVSDYSIGDNVEFAINIDKAHFFEYNTDTDGEINETRCKRIV